MFVFVHLKCRSGKSVTTRVSIYVGSRELGESLHPLVHLTNIHTSTQPESRNQELLNSHGAPAWVARNPSTWAITCGPLNCALEGNRMRCGLRNPPKQQPHQYTLMATHISIFLDTKMNVYLIFIFTWYFEVFFYVLFILYIL